jgi:hypothetical protein
VFAIWGMLQAFGWIPLVAWLLFTRRHLPWPTQFLLWIIAIVVGGMWIVCTGLANAMRAEPGGIWYPHHTAEFVENLVIGGGSGAVIALATLAWWFRRRSAWQTRWLALVPAGILAGSSFYALVSLFPPYQDLYRHLTGANSLTSQSTHSLPEQLQIAAPELGRRIPNAELIWARADRYDAVWQEIPRGSLDQGLPALWCIMLRQPATGEVSSHVLLNGWLDPPANWGNAGSWHCRQRVPSGGSVFSLNAHAWSITSPTEVMRVAQEVRPSTTGPVTRSNLVDVALGADAQGMAHWQVRYETNQHNLFIVLIDALTGQLVCTTADEPTCGLDPPR